MKHSVLARAFGARSYEKLFSDEERLRCLEKHKNGLFKREQNKMAEVIPYNKEIRSQMDSVVDHVNQNILVKRGYQPMPLHSYNYYRKVDVKKTRRNIRSIINPLAKAF